MIILKSNRLRVEIAEPGERPNDTFRFDRAGYITEVVLDQSMRFCASEPQNLVHPCSGGRGLCSEFTADYSGEAAEGEYYPKLGVGLIRREDGERYVFHRRYEDVQPFPVDVQANRTSAHFATGAVECMGYALTCERTVRVDENRLVMEAEVKNVGQRVIETEEYCHNFLSIDGMALSKQYSLAFPGIADQAQWKPVGRDGANVPVRGDGRGYRLTEFSADAYAFWVDLQNASEEVPFIWRMEHDGARAGVEVREYFQPRSIQVWAVDHMICPEVFCKIRVAPGEAFRWRREWVFSRQV